MREMKNTGVVWCPTIPDNWNIERVKNNFYISKVKAANPNPTVLKLARAGVQVRDISNNEGQLAASYDDYNPVRYGDLLLNPMDLYSGANCNMSEIDGVISPAYANLRSFKELNPKYFDYYFKLQYWTMAMFAHGKGVSFDNRWTINAEGILNYEIPVPSKEEQDMIVSAISSKCEQVDTLVANQEAQIEKLKQYKQSLITEVVTKGLNPDAELKDSTIRYIKSFPSHWENRKMLSILSMRVIDGPHESPELFDEGIPYISATAIENGKIDFQKMRGYISEEYCNECDKRYKPQVDDILVIKLGASTGQVAIVETDMRFNIWVPLAVVRCNEFAVPRFVYYAFQSDYFIKQMEQSWTYGTQQTLGVKTIERLRILLPEVKEQKEIVEYLDEQCSKIDKLIEIKQSKIAKLNEYKKSLIYEYVTGKKEA